MMPILIPATATRLSVDEAVDTIGFGRFQIGLIAACGLVHAAEGLEVVLLSVLGPVLRCIWRVSEVEVALLTSTVFLGMLIGGPLWASLADRVGKWGSAIISFSTVLYFGILSTVAPTFQWILIIRGCVGVGIGGCGVIATGLLSEFIPRSARGTTKMIQYIWWSVGTIFMGGMAAAMLPRVSWRYLVLLASIPLCVVPICFRWLLESPRYLLISEQPMKALEVLNHVARINKQRPLTITLTALSSYECRIQSLFHRDFLRSTILQWFIWFGVGISYYGAVFLTAELPQKGDLCLIDSFEILSSTANDSSCCQTLTVYAYTAVVVAAIGEMPAIFINCVILHCASKRVAISVNAFCSAVLFFSLNFCVETYVRLLLLFFLRLFTYAVFCAAYLYTIEAYPSNLRTFGNSCCSTASRLGAIFTPFVAQLILPKISSLAALATYSAVMIAVCVSTLFLPRDSSLPKDNRNYMKHRSLSEMPMLTYDTFSEKCD